MKFNENGQEGHPALALIARRMREIADPEQPGMGKKIRVHAGYVRAVRLIAQQDAGGLRQARRDLLNIVGGDCGKGWRIAEGTA